MHIEISGNYPERMKMDWGQNNIQLWSWIMIEARFNAVYKDNIAYRNLNVSPWNQGKSSGQTEMARLNYLTF